ncbi:hypothetical protein A8709_04985 [Paenibacillus pectinilyticus]|uniref:Signal peptidase I n=1 Tax=Paenibacillus pectinilyticus TaxID=512399 RepID=A0A1C0ZSM2_9BACL|nr:S24/S26 family peptidase [Paenibacillus pectinilyticus]OCT11057.1 hypothetical protein A8709_04985 [Paenibacillus pectinilyticus]
MPFPNEFVKLFAQVLKKRGWIELPAQGTSMFPFIRRGDICRFVPALATQIRRGDILLFCTPQGNLIAHRLCRKVITNEQLTLLCKGDSNLSYDVAIQQDQLIAKMDWIKRNERIIFVTSPLAYIWGHLVLTVPMVSVALQYYLYHRERIHTS